MANIRNIVKGFTNKGHEDEAYFKERMKICSECPLNTLNMEPKDISLIHATTMKTICGNKGVCTACGCCIDKKASVKEEECGKVKLGQEPLWGKIEDSVNVNPFLKIRTTSPTDASISVVNGRTTISKAFDPETEKKITIELSLTDKRGLNIIRVQAGCSCTASAIKKESGFNSKITLDVSTTSFNLPINERTVTVVMGGNKTEVINLQFTKNEL